jgi:hypothetical protein
MISRAFLLTPIGTELHPLRRNYGKKDLEKTKMKASRGFKVCL